MPPSPSSLVLVFVSPYIFSFIFTSTLYQDPHTALIKSVVCVGIYSYPLQHSIGYRFNHIVSLSLACEREVR